MDPDTTPSLNFTGEKPQIVHVSVEEIENSQNSIQNSDSDYNPFVSLQSQHLSSAGPSEQPPQSLSESQPILELDTEAPPLKKRRGRPSKNDLANIKPTRESQRSKRCPQLMVYDSFHSQSNEWSENDTKSFLAGCLKVGIEDIEGLRRYLPHKTENEINSQIRMWKEFARQDTDKQLGEKNEACKNVTANCIKNLDEWINYFQEKTKSSNASQFVISNIFLFIAEYGKFPSPKECDGIDVRAMYRYIHCMMNGVPPYGLNQVTSRVLLNCIDNLLEKLDDANLMKRLQGRVLKQTLEPEKFKEKYEKTYSRKRSKKSSGVAEFILDNPVINPMKLPLSALKPDLL